MDAPGVAHRRAQRVPGLAGGLKSTPVTIVTGFLGAGKTSLLNKVIRHLSDCKRIAVIENELGEINLDAKLVTNQLCSKEDLVTISKGCVCCSVRKDVIKALGELAFQSRQQQNPYTNIILETTGVADPGPVAFTFFANRWVLQHYHLDSIITVVDAEHFESRTKDVPLHAGLTVNEAINQVVFADLVLLNKIDLVSHEQLANVEKLIRSINPMAKVIHTRLTDDDCPQWLSQILDNGCFKLSRVKEIAPDWTDYGSTEDELSEDHDDCAADTEGDADDVDSRAGADNAAGAESVSQNVSRSPPGEEQELEEAVPRSTSPGMQALLRSAGLGKEGLQDVIPRRHMEVVHGAEAEVDVGGGQGAAPAGAGRDSGARSGGEGAKSVAVCEPLQTRADEEGVGNDTSAGSRKRTREDIGHEIVASKRRKDRVKRQHEVCCVAIHLDGEFDERLFDRFMQDFLVDRGADVFRSKGCMTVHGHEQTFVFQGVHETFKLGCDDNVEKGKNSFVFIGRNLDRKTIRQGLETCLWVPLPPGWAEYKDAASKKWFYVHESSGKKMWDRPTVNELIENAQTAGARGSSSVNDQVE